MMNISSRALMLFRLLLIAVAFAGSAIAADAGKTILFTTNSGLTLTVPASTVPNGAEVKIVNLTGSTLAISGASFLDGLSSPIANLTSCTVISYNDVPMVGR